MNEMLHVPSEFECPRGIDTQKPIDLLGKKRQTDLKGHVYKNLFLKIPRLNKLSYLLSARDL